MESNVWVVLEKTQKMESNDSKMEGENPSTSPWVAELALALPGLANAEVQSVLRQAVQR